MAPLPTDPPLRGAPHPHWLPPRPPAAGSHLALTRVLGGLQSMQVVVSGSLVVPQLAQRKRQAAEAPALLPPLPHRAW